MKLNESEITSIVYEKDSGEQSARVIIPTSVPKDLIRALDVSELEPAERQDLLNLYTEYKQYTAAFLENMFNFETWVDHTHNRTVKPKWRAFKVAGLR
jgi:hypothetical protein